MKHFVLFSAGLDSTALVLWLMNVKKIIADEILLVSFKFNSAQNDMEMKKGKELAKKLNCKRLVLPLNLAFGESKMQKGNDKDIINDPSKEGMKQVIVPFRNLYMISAAINNLSTGYKEGVIYFSPHADDILFPDCTESFLTHAKKAVLLGTGHKFKLKTPFLSWTKNRIGKFMNEYPEVRDMTYSCYMGKEEHCGICHTCALRSEALTA